MYKHIFVPTRKDVETIEVGGAAIDAFGRVRLVTKVTAKREDVDGKLFVCYCTEHGEGEMSMSLKEDEAARTVAATRAYKSHEIDRIEREILRGRHANEERTRRLKAGE